MARLPRLVIPGHAHYIVQQGHNRQPVMLDDEDRALYLAALREAFIPRRVELLAYALTEGAVHLLATPPDAGALSSAMQAVGRRYVAAFNRRHGRSGTLWDGRFRCAVVEPGPMRLQLLCLIDGLGDSAAAATPGVGGSGHRSGAARDPLLVDPPEYWQLGNTPFEREAAYRRMLGAGVSAERAQALRRAALGGWVAGSPRFAAVVAEACARPALPRPRGRPRRATA
jgi:putative transposase